MCATSHMAPLFVCRVPSVSIARGPRRAAVERRAAARAGQRRGLSRGVGVGAAAHITTQHTCAAYTAVVHIPLVSRSSRSQPFTAIHNSSHPARLGHLSAPSRSGRLQAGSSSAPCLDILQWRGGRGGGAKGDDTGFGRGATSSVGTVAEGARGLAANLIA
jgi:hypothetical protein